MRFSRLLLLGAFIPVIMSSCSKSPTNTDSTTAGNWVKRSEFDGTVRSKAVSFVIGSFAYVGTGYNSTATNLNDFWKYNPTTNTWTQIANLGGVARNSAVAFATTAKGYVGSGYDGTNFLKDFWEYDPTANTWTRKADFAGTGRYDASAFGIGAFGYVTSGYDATGWLKDCWKFDPTANTWTQTASYGGNKRSGALAFVYNNKGYIVTGGNNGQTVDDFWVFDPTAGSWSQLQSINTTVNTSYTDIQRQFSAVVVIGSKAYISTGQNASGSLLSTSWAYDFATDTWTTRSAYERSARSGAISFSVSGRGFIGLGKSLSLYLDDFDEFQPDVALNTAD